MNGASYRIPAQSQGRFATRIDRSRPVSFHCDNTRLVGVTGDTLSSALLANGMTTFGLHPHTQRPQGFFSFLDHSTPHMIALERGNLFIPSPDPNDVGLREGLSVRSTNTWKSYLANRFPSLKCLPWFDTAPALPNVESRENFEHIHTRVDVLVIGGGLAGITAAELPAEAGLEVMLVESAAFLGGISDAYDGTVEDVPLENWIQQKAAALAAKDNVTVRPLMTVIHLSPGGEAIILERITSTGLEKGSADTVRARLWFIKAQAIIMATGAYEKNLVFQDNTAVGVVSACSVRLLLRRYGVAIGKHVVLACSSDEGYRTALDLKEAGVSIEQLADLRLHPSGLLLDRVKAEGLRLSFGSAPYSIAHTRRGHALDSLILRNRLRDEGPATDREILCDTVVTSGGWQPNLQLARSIGADFVRDDDAGCMTIGYYPPGFYSAGAASGVYNVREVIQDALKAGAEVLAYVKQHPAPSYIYRELDCTVLDDEPAEHIAPLVENGPKDRAYVNERRTITVQDMLATGSLKNAARSQHYGYYYDEESRFLKPVGLAVLAGIPRRNGEARTLTYHHAKGAVYSVQDGWKIADCYAQGTENPEQAIAREWRAVQHGQAACVFDHGQLVSVSGKNTAAFVAHLRELPENSANPHGDTHAPSFDVQGLQVHLLAVNDDYVLCFALRGGKDLGSALAAEQRAFAHDLIMANEEERWSKILIVGEKSSESLPEDYSFWRLSLTCFPLYLALCPVGESHILHAQLANKQVPLFGARLFDYLLFESGNLTGEQYHYRHTTGGQVYGLVPHDPHFSIPAGSHLFAGKKPQSSRANPALSALSGYVLASTYSYRHGQQIALAVLHSPASGTDVFFRAQGDFWQGQIKMPDFSDV